MYSVTWPHWVMWKGLQQWDHMLPGRSIFHLRMAWNLTGPRQPRAQWRANSNPLAYRDQISHWVVNVVSEDGLAPYGARASADTMKTKFLCSKQESQCYQRTCRCWNLVKTIFSWVINTTSVDDYRHLTWSEHPQAQCKWNSWNLYAWNRNSMFIRIHVTTDPWQQDPAVWSSLFLWIA